MYWDVSDENDTSGCFRTYMFMLGQFQSRRHSKYASNIKKYLLKSANVHERYNNKVLTISTRHGKTDNIYRYINILYFVNFT